MPSTAPQAPLAITGIGMISALGTDAATSCAAARAGLSRAAPLSSLRVYSAADWAQVGVIGHAVRPYAEGFEGLGKLVRLASGALTDLLAGDAPQREDWARTAVCVALPSGYLEAAQARALVPPQPAPVGVDPGAVIPRALQLHGIEISPANQLAVREDQAGFATAIGRAAQLLAGGAVDRCILGGVDACTDEAFLSAAHQFGLVKTPEQAAGFQPGEAAAFLWIETLAGARARGRPCLARIDAWAAGADPVARDSGLPALGHGLADCIGRCLAALPDQGAGIGWIIDNLNGDAVRGNDWGYALARLVARFPPLGTAPVETPAAAFGEIGAASGAVAACVAVRAFARGYAPGAPVLVWLASDSSARGAFVIRPDD